MALLRLFNLIEQKTGKPLTCEQKFAVGLSLVNIVYFIVTVIFGYSFLSVVFTKLTFLLIVVVVKTKLQGKSQYK